MNKKTVTIVITFLVMLLVGWWFISSNNNQSSPSEFVPSKTSGEAIKIIAFGDSLTAGYGVLQSEAYPAQLQNALQGLGYNVEVINSGVSGETTRGNLERADFIRKQDPDIVILGIGGNDALRQLSLIDTKDNIRSTIDILQNGTNPPVILLLQMQSPLNSGFGYKRSFDSLYEEIADEKKLILVPFITTELFLDTSNKQSDGIHYNKTGYSKVIEMHIIPALEDALSRLGSDT